MSYKDKYTKINSMYGESVREQRINDTIRKLKSSFKDSPSYSKVLMSVPSMDINDAYEIDAQIVDSSDVRDEKKLTTFIENSLSSGNYIKWIDKYWLVTHFDPLGDIYKRGIMHRCYTTLRWQDKEGVVREAWFSRKTDVSPNFGVDDRKVTIVMPDERRQIVVQSNQHTQRFNKTQRFILDGRAWKIITLDDIADGIINIVLQEDQINPDVDNEELRIADYYKINYDLKLITQDNISIKFDQSYQLEVQALKNGDKVDINEIAISSSDTNVGTVDDTGLFTPIDEGTTIITFEYMGISKNITVRVRDKMMKNLTVDIEGSDSIRLGKIERYVAVFKNNGHVVDEICEFTLDNTDLVTVEEKNNNFISLKANSKSKTGKIILRVKSNNGLTENVKEIIIKGYL